MTSQKSPHITAEADLIAWLIKRMNSSRFADASPHEPDAGRSIIEILNEWSETYRYITVAFRDGAIRFTSLTCCAQDFGIEVDVCIPDVRRYDIAALT